MVECTALEMRHRCKPIGGSNPPLSARRLFKVAGTGLGSPQGLGCGFGGVRRCCDEARQCCRTRPEELSSVAQRPDATKDSVIAPWHAQCSVRTLPCPCPTVEEAAECCSQIIDNTWITCAKKTNEFSWNKCFARLFLIPSAEAEREGNPSMKVLSIGVLLLSAGASLAQTAGSGSSMSSSTGGDASGSTSSVTGQSNSMMKNGDMQGGAMKSGAMSNGSMGQGGNMGAGGNTMGGGAAGPAR